MNLSLWNPKVNTIHCYFHSTLNKFTFRRTHIFFVNAWTIIQSSTYDVMIIEISSSFIAWLKLQLMLTKSYMHYTCITYTHDKLHYICKTVEVLFDFLFYSSHKSVTKFVLSFEYQIFEWQKGQKGKSVSKLVLWSVVAVLDFALYRTYACMRILVCLL